MDQAESQTTRQPDEGRLFQRTKDIDTETSPDHRGIPGPAIKKPDGLMPTRLNDQITSATSLGCRTTLKRLARNSRSA